MSFFYKSPGLTLELAGFTEQMRGGALADLRPSLKDHSGQPLLSGRITAVSNFNASGDFTEYPSVFPVRVLNGKSEIEVLVPPKCEDISLRLGMAVSALFVTQGFSFLHASVVQKGSVVIAFLGPPRSGKSSLAAALALCGYEIYGDDVHWFRRRGGQLQMVAIPKPLKYRSDTLRTQAGDRPMQVARHALVESVEQLKLYLVFPQFKAGGQFSLERIAASEAFQRLLVDNVHIPAGHPRKKAETAERVRNASEFNSLVSGAHVLTYGDSLFEDLPALAEAVDVCCN